MGKRKARYVGCTVVINKQGNIAYRVRWAPPWLGGERRRYCLTTRIPADRAALKEARLKAREMGGRIKLGTFDPRDYFDLKGRFGTMLDRAKTKEKARHGDLSDRMKAWLEDQEALKIPALRLRDYRADCRNYIDIAEIAHLDPMALKLADFRDFKVWLLSKAGQPKKLPDGMEEPPRGISEKTACNVIRGTLKAFLRDISARASLDELQELRWERYSPKRRQDPFTADERAAIVRWFDERRGLEERAIVRLMSYGLLQKEWVTRIVGDFDRRQGSLRIYDSKTAARERVVWLPAELAEMLSTLAGIREPSAKLFAAKRDTFDDNFGRAQTSLGIRYRSPYQLKHTYATIALLDERASPTVVARNLGISLATLEKHYAHLLKKGLLPMHGRGFGPMTVSEVTSVA